MKEAEIAKDPPAVHLIKAEMVKDPPVVHTKEAVILKGQPVKLMKDLQIGKATTTANLQKKITREVNPEFPVLTEAFV